MKSKRHGLIKRIIEQQAVETQEELAQALYSQDIKVTQATVSRDIKEMQLIKVPTGKGGYRYAMPGKDERVLTKERLARLLKEYVLGMDCSENLLVLKTLPGSAGTVAAGLDQVEWPEVIGTIAGDDNILVVVKPKDAVNEVMARLRGFWEA